MDIEVDHRWRDAQEKIIDTPQNEARPLAIEKEARKPTALITPAKKRWLPGVSTALAVGIALAVIAVGVTGSIASHRQSRLKL